VVAGKIKKDLTGFEKLLGPDSLVSSINTTL
jgi:hypothetical protein